MKDEHGICVLMVIVAFIGGLLVTGMTDLHDVSEHIRSRSWETRNSTIDVHARDVLLNASEGTNVTWRLDGKFQTCFREWDRTANETNWFCSFYGLDENRTTYYAEMYCLPRAQELNCGTGFRFMRSKEGFIYPPREA